MIRNSALIEDYWIISDDETRCMIPAGSISFTLDELRALVDFFGVFQEAEVIEFKRTKK